jgi:hypothetical protein
MFYRAFYTPQGNEKQEVFQDSTTLGGLAPGSIVVIKINDDGTRELTSEKKNLNAREKFYADYAKRQLEFKHDGGSTPEFVNYMRDRNNGEA